MTLVFFVDNMNHMKILKLNNRPGENVADCCDAVLVYSERLKSPVDFNPENLGYTILIFEDTSDSIFYLWENQNYKEVTEFIMKFVCVMKMPCNLMISLHMVPLFNKLCMNNAKFLTQSGGNPMIV